ncbi:substrate-binding domain-containing protein [Planctomycetes bacterium CA13]
MTNHLRRASIPAVDVSIMMPKVTWLGRVATDDNARAQMALDHLRERGLKHFACYAPAIGRYSFDRALAFQQVVEKSGFRCHLFAEADGKSGWEMDNDSVAHWLERLPRPVAIFAADPYPARHIAELCQWNEINVPDEVAILAGDDDELLCKVSSPELSSIQLACETIGEQAAELLDRLMQGGKVPKQPQLVSPLYVRQRHSTDVHSTNAPELQEMLQFIKENSHQNLCVADILSRFSVSRRWLEQRFRLRLGRSPADHIRRVRMDAVQRVLFESDLSITQLAYQMEFTSSTSLTQQFTRHFGCSPTAMRQRG